MCLALALIPWQPLLATDHASILIYHHVSESTPESTSVTPEVFARHMDYLAANGFTVWPLGKTLDTLQSGNALPEKTVSITFDDAYQSVRDHAAPVLKRHGWPYTIFVSTRAIDEGYHNYLSWNDLAELVREGAEIGNHSYTHAHLIRRLNDENDQQWRNRVEGDIRRAQQEIQTMLGVESRLFSYPYGEYTSDLQELVGALGYFGITQQSGAIGPGFDTLAVPRFPMATQFADMERLVIAANARPLPIRKVETGARILKEGVTSKQHYSFDIRPDGYRLSGLACYSNDGARIDMDRTPNTDGIHISMALPDWPTGVRKVNCTAPSSTEKDVYYWYAQLWIVQYANGSWKEE